MDPARKVRCLLDVDVGQNSFVCKNYFFSLTKARSWDGVCEGWTMHNR
jgi:hypothetical protein